MTLLLVTRYDDEVRALFRRVEHFRADKKGIESTFSPTDPSHVTGPGPGAAPQPNEKEDPELPGANPVDQDLDLEQEGDIGSLRNTMLSAIFAKEDDKAEKAKGRIHEVSSDAVETAECDALFDAALFDRDGDPEVLKRLREKGKDPRLTAYVENLTGLVLETVKRPAEAAEAYKNAYEAAADKPELRAGALSSRARVLVESGQAEQAGKEVTAALVSASDPAARSKLWRALAETYKARGQHFKEALTLQEAREHEPNNAELCFSIAWALSQSERDDVRPLSIHFYRLAIYLDPKHQYALNNLGWEYEKADLKVEASRYYKMAVNLGNTLAMANLAGMKVRAGFADEAEELLKKAQKQDDVHENVAGVMVDVSRDRTNQSAKAKQLDEAGGILASFCSQATRAESDDAPTELPEQWHWRDGNAITVELKEGALECYWAEGDEKFKIEAELRGRSGSGRLYKMGHRFSVMKNERVETSWEKKQSVLLVAAEDGQSLQVARLSEEGADIKKMNTVNQMS